MTTSLFLRQFLRNPRQISSIVPSSPYLARAMAQGLSGTTGRVVEFGPGTGSLTQGILAAGVRPADLTLFELDSQFVATLRQQFAGVTVLNVPADQAPAHIAPGVGAVVSGLPLLSIPHEICAAIVKAAFDILAPGAPFIQFTYGPKPSIPADIIADLGLDARQSAFVWRNLPPARVYRFTRNRDQRLASA